MLNNSRKFLIFTRLFLCGALFFAGLEKSATIYAQSGAVEARVTSVGGAATISGNGRGTIKLARRATLAPGDEIDTTGGGRVVIDLTDGSQIVVLPNSRVRIGSFQNAASLRELLQITLGRIRVKINHFKGKPNPYRIKSPTASIAVRGTVFEVSVEPLGDTLVVVIEGSVEVASLRDPSKPLLAEPGRNVIVRPNFTIEFFAADALNREVGERDRQKLSNQPNNNNENGGTQSATNIYERSIESIVESGETALPSRFVAFPDAHLDSLDNPAYAGEFRSGEARINFVPSLNGSSNAEDDLRDRYGIGIRRPLDFAVLPEGTVFVPVDSFRAVVGGSAGYVRSGLQSLAANDNFPLLSPPYPAGTVGLNAVQGATRGNLFSGSLIFARRFGKSDQTSVGFSVERLYSRGSLNETITERDGGGTIFNETIDSRSMVNRTRYSFGVLHNFGSAKFGAFYRYGSTYGVDADRSRFINGAAQPNDFIQTKGSSSEFGFRLRGAFSRRLFYGAEGTMLFGRTNEILRRSVIAPSTERDRANRATLGIGIGYIFRPRTIFSFDVASGLIGIRQRRTEDFTSNTLETERGRARFLSLHAAVQTDVWRNLFVSASVLSLTQSRRLDTQIFPDRFGRLLTSDGLFSTGGRTNDFYTDIYSNFGAGWRIRPNLIFQYILTTDYGQTASRHTFLLRYTFDF